MRRHETDEADTGRETIPREFSPASTPTRSGSCASMLSKVGAVRQRRARRAGRRLRRRDSPALQAFIRANATKPFDVQLALPLRGAA